MVGASRLATSWGVRHEPYLLSRPGRIPVAAGRQGAFHPGAPGRFAFPRRAPPWAREQPPGGDNPSLDPAGAPPVLDLSLSVVKDNGRVATLIPSPAAAERGIIQLGFGEGAFVVSASNPSVGWDRKYDTSTRDATSADTATAAEIANTRVPVRRSAKSRRPSHMPHRTNPVHGRTLRNPS